jgi:hypothetical protein
VRLLSTGDKVLFFKKINRLRFLYVLLFPCLFVEQAVAIDQAIDIFVACENAQSLDCESSIHLIFKAFNVEENSVSKVASFELKKLSIEIKKNSSNPSIVRALKQRREILKRLKKHLRQHRVEYNFLEYAALLERRYKHAFNNDYVVEDVYRYTELYDYSPKGGDSLMRFLRLLQADLAKISRFESKMHCRYGRLKALNYFFKLECLKVRNEILFHPWYRYRLHQGGEFLADAMSPIVYMGKVLFHVVPSVFCILGLTASTALSGSGPNQD